MPPERNDSIVVPATNNSGPTDSVQERTPLIPVPNNPSIMSRLSYGFGNVFNDICASLWFSYTLLFLHEVVGMPGTNAGAILMLGQIVDALATPFVGMLADKPLRGPFARFGRRKFWHFIGSVLVLFSFPFIFMPCLVCESPVGPVELPNDDLPLPTFGPLPSPEAAKQDALEAALQVKWWQHMLWYAPLVAVFQVGWAAVQIAHLALIPDLTSDERGRTELTAVRFTMSVCSSVVVYLITWSVIRATRTSAVDQIGPGDAYKFRNIVIIGTLVGLVFTIWFYVGTREPISSQQRPSRNHIKGDNDDCNLLPKQKKTTASFFRDPRLYQAAFLYVSSRLFTTLSQVFVPLYLNESLGEAAESIALVPLATFLASFAASLVVRTMNDRCGRMLTYMIGALLCLVGCIWIYLGEGPAYQKVGIYMVAVLLGAGSSVTLVTSLCITADLIGDSTDSGAAVYSAVTFTDKLFNGLAVMLIESLKCGDIRSCPHYYRDALALVCGGTVIFGIAVLATYWKPNLRNLRSRFMGRTNRIP